MAARTIVVYGSQGKSFLGLWIKQWAYRNRHAAFIADDIGVDLHNAMVAGNIAFLTEGETDGWQTIYLNDERQRETRFHRHADCNEECAAKAAIRELEELLLVSDAQREPACTLDSGERPQGDRGQRKLTALRRDTTGMDTAALQRIHRESGDF